MASDNLDANRKTLLRKAARNRDCRMRGGGYVIACPHPVNVAFHFYAVDFKRVLLLDRKRRHLVDRKDKKLIGLHEAVHMLEQRGAQFQRAGDLRGSQLPPSLDI